METENTSKSALEEHKEKKLVDLLKDLEEKCGKCNPLTPLTCVTDCKTWRLKNQLRKIDGKMQKPNFVEKLLNTLKNERRLQLLEIISKQHYSLSQVQQKLKSLGYSHSQQTILEEYINPLVEVGLVLEDENPFRATILGCKVNELVRDFPDLEFVLPPHSECHEEIMLDALLDGSRTHEDMKTVVPAKSVPRVLSRLQKAALVQTSKEKNYIFFFRTKRQLGLETLSSTERRVYDNISTEGVSAKKLSDGTGISLRRTYKYLRKLKGKKLVFTRKKPLCYSLTPKGSTLAGMLKAIRDLTVETRITTAQLLRNGEETIFLPAETCDLKKKSDDVTVLPETAHSQLD